MNLTTLTLCLALDLVAVAVLVWGVYLPRRPDGGFAFAAVLLNLVTFSVSALMNTVDVDLGFGLGLFAIFGILRYRTEALAMVDLTYLFVAIGLAVINGLGASDLSLLPIILTLDVAAVLLTAAMAFLSQRVPSQVLTLTYDRLDLLGAEHRAALASDIESRLGTACEDISVGRVDMLRETVELTVRVRLA